MKDGDRIICFGDSVTNLYASELEKWLNKYISYELDLSEINAGIGGETTRDAIARLQLVLDKKPDYVIISFGMNDCLKDPTNVTPLNEFRQNLIKIVNSFIILGTRVILLTINPVRGKKANEQIDMYNQAICDVWKETKVRLVDINSHWKKDFQRISDGLDDSIHPNKSGIDLITNSVHRMLYRHSYILLWMYNGNPCACNYKCPYCTYDSQRGHHFTGTIEGWRSAFKKNFGDQYIIFYFGHGEPMIGKNFYDVLEMIGDEPKWEGRMISNLSPNLEKFVRTKVVREGRFNVNGSFHPHMTSKEKFLEKLQFLREHGIETPVVYTMYPPLLKQFEEDFSFFTRHGFIVHVRRFFGLYNGKKYPEAYTEEEVQFIAKYCDDQTIKSMLFDEPSYGKLTWSGVDFFSIDNNGNVGYCDDCRPESKCLGNIFDGTFILKSEPQPFPEKFSSDGTVDGVSNFVDVNYDQLKGNQILDFSKKGGVFKTENGVYYKNMDTNFDDPKIRAEYHFPCRNISDVLEVLRNDDDSNKMKVNRLKFSLNKNIFNSRNNYSIIYYLNRRCSVLICEMIKISYKLFPNWLFKEKIIQIFRYLKHKFRS